MSTPTLIDPRKTIDDARRLGLITVEGEAPPLATATDIHALKVSLPAEAGIAAIPPAPKRKPYKRRPVSRRYIVTKRTRPEFYK